MNQEIRDFRRRKASSLPEIFGGGDQNDNFYVDPGVESRSADKDNNDSDSKQIKKQKTVMHKEVERQRRQEMASLHDSLRALLPHEYLKGKRSMADHLDQAVKYIRHLKASNQVLRNKRDKLRTLQTITTITNDAQDTNHNSGTDNERKDQPQEFLPVAYGSSRGPDRVVVVKPCKEGVEVLVRVGQEEKLPLSMVFKALAQEGLDVTKCTSSNMGNDNWLHCLQAEVREGSNIGELQQKLETRISST